MNKFSVKTIVAIGIGAALFFVLGRFVAIPSPVPNTNISIQYGVLAFFAAVFGPVAGVLTGLIGHTLIDLSWGSPWWSWIIASGVFGLLVGIAAKVLKFDKGTSGMGLVKFNVSQVIAHVICWGCVAPVLDIVIYKEPIEKLFAQGLMAGISNAVTTAIVASALLATYELRRPKEDSLKEEA